MIRGCMEDLKAVAEEGIMVQWGPEIIWEEIRELVLITEEVTKIRGCIILWVDLKICLTTRDKEACSKCILEEDIQWEEWVMRKATTEAVLNKAREAPNRRDSKAIINKEAIRIKREIKITERTIKETTSTTIITITTTILSKVTVLKEVTSVHSLHPKVIPANSLKEALLLQ